jgi:glutamine amidotransferase
MIVIVDYRMGNVGSILNMLRRLGADALISSQPDVVASAAKLILPGVGAFDTGMQNLEQSALVPVLNERVLGRGTPVLGICLGMQLLLPRSEEGTRPGLGWIGGEALRFQPNGALKVPHMGWNTVSAPRASRLLDGVAEDARFYFVHSFYVDCAVPDDVAGRTHYGHDFVSAIERGPIQGTQFHPEKSHRFGLQLLANFVEAA